MIISMAASTSSASPQISTDPASSLRMPVRISSWSSTRKTRGCHLGPSAGATVHFGARTDGALETDRPAVLGDALADREGDAVTVAGTVVEVKATAPVAHEETERGWLRPRRRSRSTRHPTSGRR